MKNTLLLTASEQKIFDDLPETLREGWSREEEQWKAVSETPDQIRMRLHLVRLHDPKLQSFLLEAQKNSSVDAISSLILGTNLKGVGDADLAELFFALGPNALSQIITSLLASAKTDDDIASIESLTLIRHLLLASLVS